MKKSILLFLLVAFTTVTMAQVQGDGAKKQNAPQCAESHSKCGSQDCQAVMKLKKDFFESNFTLNEDQKRPFWAAFDARAKAEFDAFIKSREAMNEAGIDRHVSADSVKYLSDSQIISLYSIRLETRRQLLEAETKFFNAISQCLSAKQVNEYFQLERKFKRSAANHKHNPSHKPTPANKEKCPAKSMQASPSK